MARGRIESIKKVLAYENPWVKVYFDQVSLPDGRIDRFTRIVDAKCERGVLVVPVDERGRVCILRVYRYGVGDWEWEVPGGGAESGLTARENARRELRDETGLEAGALKLLGVICLDASRLSTMVYVYMAENLKRKGRGLPPSEGIAEMKFVTPQELVWMIAHGQLREGKTLAGLCLAFAKGASNRRHQSRRIL